MEIVRNNLDSNVYDSVQKERLFINTKGDVLKDDFFSEYINQLREFILQEGYPCIGAQAAANSKSLTVGIFKKMDDRKTAREVAFGLLEYLQSLKDKPSSYLTFVAIFPFDTFGNEKEFEDALWKLLNKMHVLDHKYYDWPSSVGSNPKENDFAFSFGGEGFFLVGMHPESSRRARRFRYPSIAFNLHAQFEVLRKKGRYNLMKKATRVNELQFDKSINPMLNDFGKGLEAPQYSGRKVDENWKCPFSEKIFKK